MVEEIKKLFENMNTAKGWDLNLLRISLERGETKYAACHITLDPPGKIREFATSLLKRYCEGNKALLDQFSTYADYDGSFEANTVYRLNSESELISGHFFLLREVLANPTYEAKPVEFNASAYVISASIEDIGRETIPIKLFSVQSPMMQLKHRFLHDSNTFKEISAKVLYLRESIDVFFYGSTVYFLDMKGEKLFSMERSYRKKCRSICEKIKGLDICSNVEVFTAVAESGANPRRFVSFNQSRLEALLSPETRTDKAAMLHLEVGDGGKINTSDKQNAEKLIKVLCKKGMFDPFDEVPVEVPTSRKW